MRTRIAKNLEWLFKPQAPARAPKAMFAVAGKEPFSLPSGFSGHDYAVYLLHIAAEIEHLLMVQYLYAAYSLGGAQVPMRSVRMFSAGRRPSSASPRRRWLTSSAYRISCA